MLVSIGLFVMLASFDWASVPTMAQTSSTTSTVAAEAASPTATALPTLTVGVCDSSPCSNGGSCVASADSFACVCTAGFTGATCHMDIDECASSPCENGGTCSEGFMANFFECACVVAFTGERCHLQNDCPSSPCTNGGSCTPTTTGFSCECPAGFFGDICQSDTDECASSPCQNGASCSEGAMVSFFECSCAPGFIGVHCELVDLCISSPCSNGATCETTNSTAGTKYECTCPAGFTSALCEVDIDECTSSPCSNGGTCQESSMANAFECTCPAGFTSALCDVDIDECTSSPCSNGGTCQESSMANAFECTCPAGFTSALCDEDIDECTSSPCLNGGTCSEGSMQGFFECQCVVGWSGTTCSSFDASPTPTFPIDFTNVPDVPTISEDLVEVELASCTCDLTVGSCNINCCCDADCSPADIALFAVCQAPLAPVGQDTLCVAESSVYRINDDGLLTVTRINSADGSTLLCLSRDNNRGRFFFPSVPLATTNAQFDALLSLYNYTPTTSTTSTASRREAASSSEAGNTYRRTITRRSTTTTSYVSYVYAQSLPVLFTSSSSTVLWRLPAASPTSSLCSGHSGVPVQFGVDVDASECVVQSATCAPNSALDATLFTTGITLSCDGTDTFLNNNDTCHVDLTTDPSVWVCRDPITGVQSQCGFLVRPTFDSASSLCRNVLESVSYTVHYNASTGQITSAAANAVVLTQVSASSFNSFMATQRFSVTFVALTSSTDQVTVTSPPRSGNPGYLRGLPVLAGTRVTDGALSAIALSTDPNEWLTLAHCPTPATATPATAQHYSVVFGVDALLGCTLALDVADTASDTACDTLQLRTEALLLGASGNVNVTHLGRFGNSSYEAIGDWVALVDDGVSAERGTPQSEAGTCPSVLTGVAVDIAIARAGSLANPQWQIVGARLRHTVSAVAVAHACPHPSALCPSTTPLTLRSTVSFIDVSPAPSPTFAQSPRAVPKFPQDFFYPF